MTGEQPPLPSFYGAVPRTKTPHPFDYLPYAVLPGCVLFNFILCYVNTKIMGVTVPMIVACEMVLVALSAAYGFFRLDRLKLYWLGILFLQMILMLVLSAYRDELLMKPIRDMIIMPVFVVLGLSAARLSPPKLILWVSALIAAIMFYEAWFVEHFTSYFNIRQYYIDKGTIPEEQYTPLNLIASGLRPNERFLFDLNIHRVSSVFLEPVSLGFFGFLTGLYFIAVKKDISRALYIGGLAFSFLFILFSDGRMAFGALMLMLIGAPVLRHVDHRFAALVFPCVLILSFAIYALDLLGTDGEGIGARIADTMNRFRIMDLDLFLGLTTAQIMSEDSGLLKLFQWQGIAGVLLFWLPPYFMMSRMSAPPRIYLFGIAIFTSFGLMLSPAILSLKTASWLWFFYGYLVARYDGPDSDMYETAEK